MPVGLQSGKPTIKERQRLLREDAILDGARDLLVSRGLGAMTLEDLSAHVGISKPTLYLHFRSKEEVVAGMMTRGLRAAGRKLHEFSSSLPAAEALKALIEWLIDERAQNECCPMTDLCTALSQLAQEPIRVAEREFCLEIERHVEAAQRAGAARPGVPAILVSQALLSIAKDRSYRDMLAEGSTNVPTMKRAVVQMLLGD